MLKSIALGAAGILLAGTALADTPTLTVSTYGIAQDDFRKILFDPFEAECGCKVVVDIGNNAERLAKIAANPDGYDLVAFSDFGALDAANRGLLQPIDTAKLTNYDKLYDSAKDPVGNKMAVGYTIYATSIVYRTDKFGTVNSWADLLSDKAKGQVAIPNITTTQGPLILHRLAKAAGDTDVSYTNEIQKLADAKGDIVTFYERSSQLTTLFAQEEIWLAPTGRYAWGNLLKTGLPLAWATPKEGQTGGMNVLSLVKGSKHPDLALKLIDKWLSTETQTALGNALVDSPANKEARLEADKGALMTYGADQINSISFIKPADLLAHQEQWIKDWNAKISQ